MSRYTVHALLVDAKSATGAGMFHQAAEPARINFSISCPSECSSTVESCLDLLKTFPNCVVSEKQSMGNSPTKCRLTNENPTDMHAFSILDASLVDFAKLVRAYRETAKGEAKEIVESFMSQIDALLLSRVSSLTM